ncbi:PglZ domain-containing protein [Roseivirga sp. BDSF3-8]|uniref:T9SS response regulator signal transducer PorX n=1 Tax=Roseivirga sp. BDSF3-8 TaxID=3241598 RepID=UPI003531C86F
MQRYTILWADDEIDLLKPHILFLEKKGYDVTPVNSGADAVEACEDSSFDLVFLDENMPGMTGLETLTQIKSLRPSTPVVMITKSEEEHIMEEAIGSKIADYLIKPVNPNQILLSAKKLLENKRLVSERTNIGYQQDFRNISMAFSEQMNHEDWADVYKKLIYWELEIENTEDKSMFEVLDMQKTEANANFTKFIIDNYEEWLNDPDSDRPVMSHQLMRKKVFPALQENKSLWFLVIDNLRYDQWKVLQPVISEYFRVEEEESYYSILPTTTAYSRNAIFSGMMPTDMAKFHPDIWKGEDDDEGKNMHEEDFLLRQIEKNKLNIKSSYHKILHVNQGRQLVENVHNLMSNDLNVVVYNFVDMLSHARTDLEMIRELAPDEAAYRSLTHSWFQHSPLLDLIRSIGEKGGQLMITTDHGTIRVKKPFKIIGDRNVNTNLRYKQGKNLGYDGENVFSVYKPEDLFLPKVNVSTSYVFAVEDYFFAYPNNYNYYVNHYKDTFQHGGVSMEEMIIPFITLSSKNG